MDKVYVRDFRQTGLSDLVIIEKAVQYAKANKLQEIIFEPCTYQFTELNDQFGNPKKVHLHIEDFPNLKLIGEVDAEGNPLTKFVGKNPLKNGGSLPSILKLSHCDNAQVMNIAFSLEPYFGCLGKVIDKSENRIIVEVLEGPVVDGMAAFCMNRFDLEKRKLIGISVTYGTDIDAYFQLIGEKTLRLDSEMVAKHVNVGEGLTWHFSADTFFQVFFYKCENLYLENLRTINCGGFAMIANRCHNVTAKKIVFKPEGQMLFTGPRDAWKLNRCSGKFEIDAMYVEGVRMDGQNMHSSFLTLEKLIDDYTCLFKVKYDSSEFDCGTTIRFWKNFSYYDYATIKDYEVYNNEEKHVHYVKMTFEEKITEIIKDMEFAIPDCWSVNSYHMNNSQFVNIAGSGHVVRIENVLIENTSYINNMMPAIHIGAEWKTFREATHPRNIVVQNCYFENSGYFCWGSARKHRGAISIGADTLLSGPYNQNILIQNNTFVNNEVAISISDSKNVRVVNNKMQNNNINIQLQDEVYDIIINND